MPEAPQIAVYKTHRQVLDVRDLLSDDPRRDKIQVIALNYRGAGPGSATERAVAYLDRDDARLLFFLIRSGSLPDGEWTDYKGSPNRAYASGYESRTFRVRQLDPAKYRQPWAVTITVGEGQRVGRGAVQPKKGCTVTARVSVLLGEWPMRKLAARVLDYIRTWELARRLLAEGVTSEIPKSDEEEAVVRDQQIPDGAGLLPNAEGPPTFTCEQCGRPIADCTTGGRTWTVSQLVDLAVAGAQPLLCGVCLGKSESLTG